MQPGCSFRFDSMVWIAAGGDWSAADQKPSDDHLDEDSPVMQSKRPFNGRYRVIAAKPPIRQAAETASAAG